MREKIARRRPADVTSVTSPVIEDYLAILYSMLSDRLTPIAARLAERLNVAPPAVSNQLRRMERDGLIRFGPRREITLTERGYELATIVVRRHHLVERWLVDVLGLPWADAHHEAHDLEHSLSPVVERQMMKIMGYPTTCPHGNPIPGSEVESSWSGFQIDHTSEGAEVVVERITEEGERDREFLRQLAEYDIKPGARIDIVSMDHWTGAVTLRREGRQLNLDRNKSTHIRVRPLNVEQFTAPRPDDEVLFRATVESVTGPCQSHHQVGDCFEISSRTPNGLCADAFAAMYPRLRLLRAISGSPLSNPTEPVDLSLPCPNDGHVVFRIERFKGHQPG